MQSLRALLIFTVTFTIGCTAALRAASEEEEKAETVTKMRRVWEAIMAFKKEHGQVPDNLSDLVPDFLPDKDTLISPTEKRTGRKGDNSYVDPNIRSSFCYEFSAREFAGQGRKFREVKEAQMEEFGGVVPILRCFLYDRVLNIGYSGDAYESALFWEVAPEARAITARIGPGPGFKNGEFATMKVADAENREPIAGAEVQLTDRMYHFLPLPDRTLRTAADGTVRVPLGPADPPSRELTVNVLKPGYVTVMQKWREGALPKETTVALQHAVTVGGTVKFSDGALLPGAQVKLSHAGPNADGQIVELPLATEMSGPDGRWKCERIPKTVAGLIVRVNHPSAWTKWFISGAEPGPSKVPLASFFSSTAELRVTPAATLRGTVQDADGNPARGAAIIAITTTPLPQEGIPVIRADSHYAERAEPEPFHTDAQGRYSVPWRSGGEITLLVFPSAGAAARLKFEATPEMEAHDIRLDRGRTITGRVIGDDGKPVRGTKVIFAFWGDEKVPVQKTVAKSDDTGNFSWTSAPSEQVTLQFRCNAFSTGSTVVDAEQKDPISVSLRRIGRQ